jgi:hypothetical protein
LDPTSSSNARPTTRTSSSATGRRSSYAGGDYAEAVLCGRRSIATNPRFVGNFRFLTASLATSGELEEARTVG